MSAEAVEPLGALVPDPLPAPFLTVRVQRLDLEPSLTAVCDMLVNNPS